MTDLGDLVAAALPQRGPSVVGLAGPVAVGKSTVAAELSDALWGKGMRVRVLTTDAYLLPNAILAERGLEWRKGFPESFDADALADTLRRIKAGAWPVRVPVYSHAVYDIVPGRTDTIDEADVVIVEGVVALQPPAVDVLDVAIYIDADEAHVRQWFVARFVELTETARTDPTSFYAPFASMPPDALRGLAEATWDGINAVNLHEHIAPSRARAAFVVRKGADHAVLEISFGR